MKEYRDPDSDCLTDLIVRLASDDVLIGLNWDGRNGKLTMNAMATFNTVLFSEFFFYIIFGRKFCKHKISFTESWETTETNHFKFVKEIKAAVCKSHNRFNKRKFTQRK